MKANKAHTIPLTPAVKAAIEAMPRIGDYVFASPHTPDRPFSNWSRSMSELRNLSGICERFTAHDWRRTASTNLNRLGIIPAAVEHLLAHAQPKIAGTYNRYQYQREVAHALLAYEHFLRNLSTSVPTEQTEERLRTVPHLSDCP